MTTDSVAGYAAGGSRSHDDSTFPALFVAALRQFIRKPASMPLLRAFWSAYEHRRALEWLGESGQLPGYPDGLEFAFREAMSMLRYPERRRTACTCQHFIPDDIGVRLEQAGENLANDVPAMRSFERRIIAHDSNGHSIGSIQQALAKAFRRYVEQQENTAPGVPW